MKTALSITLTKEIEKWLKDFKKTQPTNLMIDEETFEGSAYLIFKRVLWESKKLYKNI